jgi:uncharacterized protein YkwD
MRNDLQHRARFENVFRRALPALVTALLAACGGGGGDSQPTSSSASAGSGATPSPGGGSTAGGSGGGTAGALNLCGNATTIAAMVAKINAVRSVGRSCGTTFYPATTPLAWNDKLTQAAEGHSVYTANAVAAGQAPSHTGAGGSTVGDRVTATGYAWQYVGENIAGGQDTVDEVFDAWIGSPGHCANLMSPNFTDYGFACAFNSASIYRTHWTQVFAKPQ